MNPNNSTLKNNNNQNENKNKKRLSSDDDEMQRPGISRERREDPYESCAGSGDGDTSKKEKVDKLPKVVGEEILLDT